MKKIYVADDEEIVAKLFRDYLEAKGFQVRIQTKSEKIIEEISEYCPDLIFLDYRMSPLTGVDVLERMQALKLSYPVVMMSAYKRREGVFEMKRLGAWDYIGKPFDFQEVDEILSRLSSMGSAT